jgi:hypothetical protein
LKLKPHPTSTGHLPSIPNTLGLVVYSAHRAESVSIAVRNIPRMSDPMFSKRHPSINQTREFSKTCEKMGERTWMRTWMRAYSAARA